MEMKCSFCHSVLSKSNLKFSCSHFLCNKCLSRKLLLSNFSPLTTTTLVVMKCDCGGNITVPYSTCLNDILASDVQKKKNKYCNKHNAISDTYCPECRLWLCSECISSFHYEYFKNNHKLCPEDKMITSKCFYHRENTNDYFCKTCDKLICHKCISNTTDTDNLHNNHKTYSLEEYHKMIKNKKKYLKYKNYDEIMRFIDSRENEITKDFGDRCQESKKYIEEAINKLQNLKNNYISKYNQQLTNLKNIFSIIRQCYQNFYKELDGDKIDFASFDFISQINNDLNNISYTPVNFDLIESIHHSLNEINSSLYYKIKFHFKKLFYKKSQSIDNNKKGITAICPLKFMPKAFACGTIDGKIQIYAKEDGKRYSMITESKKGHNNSINVLIELKKNINNEKNEKYLLSGSNDKNIGIWTIETSSNQQNKDKNTKYSLSLKKEISNDGIILSILELTDGRIASSSSDKKIKIWYVNGKKEDIKIENDELGFEACLAEASTLENDEFNKSLISGGNSGKIKCWNIFSGTRDYMIECNCSIITCMININNHTIAVGTGEGPIIIVDLFKENNQKYLFSHKKCVNSICYLKSKDRLFSCSKDMTIKIWDLDTLTCTNTLYRQHKSIIYGIIVCENDLISCSNDGTINAYSIDENDNDSDNDEEENYDKFE